MTKAEALKVAENQIAWNSNDIVELMKKSYEELGTVCNNSLSYFAIVERTLNEYKFMQERIMQAQAQKHAIEAITEV